MARLIVIKPKQQTASPPASLPDIPQPGLSAVAASTSQINLTASYTGPPTLATYTFQYAVSASGPFTNIVTQAGTTYAHTGLVASTTYFYRVCVNTSETPSRTGAWSATQNATTQSVVSPGFFWLNLGFGTADGLNPLRFANRGFSGTNGWADLVGMDSVSGQMQPPDATGAIWGGTPPNPTSIQCIGVNPLTDQSRILMSATKHDGSTGTIYRNTLNVPYVGQPVGGAQNDYITWPDTVNGNQGMVYVRKWVYLQSDFMLRMRNANTKNNGVTTSTAGFFILSTCKTGVSSARVNLSIARANASGFADATQSYFQVDYDWFPNGVYSNFRVFAIGPSPTVTPTTGNTSGFRSGPAVPVGEWFMVEHAYRMSAGNDGWCWVAVNGTEIFLAQGPNMDSSISTEKINRLFPHSVYTNLDRASSTFSYDVDLIQISTSFPPDATSRSQALS